MRILYGLSGDGLGHAMRARVVATHLVAGGHEVTLATWGRAAALLRRHGFSVIQVQGIGAEYEGGKLCRKKTFLRVLRETPERLAWNAGALFRQAAAAPEAVLTDFNGFACAVGHAFGVPTISLDHQHVLDRFHHPWRLVSDFAVDFALARAVVSRKTPRCDRYLVTSFFFPQASSAKTTSIVGPLMRPEAQGLEPSPGDHVVVYQTARGDARLLAALHAMHDVPFHVYGYGAPGRAGNVELRHFDEARFLEDLAASRALITNGGFSAISEALYFGKPVLSIPLEAQAEQQLNAAWLEHLGLGQRAASADARALRRFLDAVPDLDVRGDARLRTGTRDALAQVDRALAEVA